MKTMTYPEKRGVKCAVCGRGFTDAEWENRHDMHEEGCQSDHGGAATECDCDNPVHEQHCPECHPDRALTASAEWKQK
jgi:hypothetical protein